jgi:hypothetical protein
MKQNDSNKHRPPYIAWETLKTYLRTLKDSAVPNRIEASMMPPTMSGFCKAGVTSALKFFSLIDSNSETTGNLKEIVGACDTEKWSDAIKKILVPAYADFIGELKLESAIRKELEEKFEDATAAMKGRHIRFYLPMMQEAGEKISTYLTARQNKPRKSGTRKTKKKKKQIIRHYDESSEGVGQMTPKGMFDQLIPIGENNNSLIRVPRNITVSQFELVKAAVNVIEAMAKQNEGS